MPLTDRIRNSWQPEKGERFSRSRGRMIVEIARILAVSRDPQGIMHVRFELQGDNGGRAQLEGQRTLALESFRRLYPEPVISGV